MKTIFHDNESGTKLEIEGTFANSKAQLLDNEENVLAELECSYSEILEMINQFSEGEDRPEKEEPKQYEEPLTASDFRGAKVKVLEDIEDEYGDILKKGTITTDVIVSSGENLYVKNVIVEPNDFKKLEIVKFLFNREESLPLKFRNSEGVEQGIRFEDVTRLENQEGNSKRFDFCAKNNILFTEDTDLEKTKVSLTKDSSWIEDDGSL